MTGRTNKNHAPGLLLWLLLSAFGAPAGADPAGVERAGAALADGVEALVSFPEIAGLAVVVVSPDEVLYQRLAGRTRVDGGRAVDAATRFRVASVSKGFASTLAAMLVREGALSLEDRVVEHVDYFRLHDPDETRRARIEHLLSHRTGLPYNAFDRLLEADWDPRRIVRRYEQVEPLCSVGSCYAYQNISYDLIATIAAARAGRPFEAQVAARIFRPLAMDDAGYGPEHLTRDPNFAHPHVFVRRGVIAPEKLRTQYYRVPAAAGVNLDVEDLARWLMAQLGAAPAVLDEALLAELRKPRVVTRRELRGGWRRARLENAWYGLGWRIYDYAGHQLVYHGGAVEGYRALVAIFPDRQVALGAMWNSGGSRPWGLVPTFADALYGLRAEDWLKLEGEEPERLSAP